MKGKAKQLRKEARRGAIMSVIGVFIICILDLMVISAGFMTVNSLATAGAVAWWAFIMVVLLTGCIYATGVFIKAVTEEVDLSYQIADNYDRMYWLTNTVTQKEAANKAYLRWLNA